MNRISTITAFLLILALSAFQKPGPSTGITIKKRWEMPGKLREISGISYLDAERFACVQDELGIIFIYNTGTKTIEKEIPFGGTGDYEGLTIVNETVWVVRSDGHLFEIKSFQSGKPTVAEYSTPLTAQHDIESICYDQKNSRLLLTTKQSEPGNPTYKGIYGFDLSTMKLSETPVYKIDFSSGKKKSKNSSIMPSDIAIHPLTGDIYIIDGRNSKLLVTNGTGAVKKLYQLNIKEFPQPEGIAFNPSGDLFISNEGRSSTGNILSVEIAGE